MLYIKTVYNVHCTLVFKIYLVSMLIAHCNVYYNHTSLLYINNKHTIYERFKTRTILIGYYKPHGLVF